MTRIDELQQKYPTLPRDFIIKWEVKTYGVRDTDDLDKVSHWSGAHTSYQIKFDDVTLPEIMAKRPHRLKDGRMLRPGSFMLASSVSQELYTNTKSPYEIRDIGEGKVALFEGEEKIDAELYFPRPKPREGAEPLTSKGTPISRLFSAGRNCGFFQLVHHCEYFASGDQCRFCKFNPSQEEARSLGITRPATENAEDMLEAILIRGSEVRLLEVRSDMGGFKDSEKEKRIYLDIFEKIGRGLPYKPHFMLETQEMSRKDMQRLKDSGMDGMSIHIECWDPALFPEVCPGKAKHASYERWMESFHDGVDLFGPGYVSSRTVGGITLIPPQGHKTWQEARDSHIEHVRSMIKDGIFPAFGQVSLPPGSVYGDDPANREKCPPTEYYLEVAMAHHQAMLEYGFYDKMDKFLWCGLDCAHALYAGELGALELAGDWGNWMRDVVPDKANWILQWLSAIKAPAT